MAIFVPSALWLQYGKISSYLAATATSKNLLFKGRDLVPSLSEKIEIVRNAFEWKLNLDPTDETLNDTGLYLYALCGRYTIQAQRVINAGETGEIIDPNTGNQVTIATPLIQFRVGDVGAPMTAGQTSLTLNYAGVVNPSIEITLDGTELPYDDNNQISYTATYNPTNIQIVFNQGVQNTQLYMIHFIQLIPV